MLRAPAEAALREPAPPDPQPRAEVSAQLNQLKTEALSLLLPFCDRLDHASEALRLGDSEQARRLLRAASFALGDLRSLLEVH